VVGFAYATTCICFVLATRLTTRANAIFIQSASPLYVLLLAPLLLREPGPTGSVHGQCRVPPLFWVGFWCWARRSRVRSGRNHRIRPKNDPADLTETLSPH
jgi:hypothetical protein